MTKSARELVECFYHQVWNKADEDKAREILDADFRFRGSLGPEKHGPEGFIAYMRAIHRALGKYECIIEELVVTENRVAAHMLFRGTHRNEFFGVPATGKEITWVGAAFFTVKAGRITHLWVLGDIDSVKQQLGEAASVSF